MKLIIDQSPDYEELTITIKCGTMDERVSKLISQIRLCSFSIIGKKDGFSYSLSLDEILYFETVDDKTFVYLKDSLYESDLKLYELESQLANTCFTRISKSCILNIEQLSHVRAMLNGKYEVTLKNGEKLMITRHYVSKFKESFKREGDRV